MIGYNDEYDAYVIEFDDAVICWNEEPEADCEQTAAEVREVYLRNIEAIAAVIYDEIKTIFQVSGVDEVIKKLGRPQIHPDDGQVTYCEHSFDDQHIISFEYLDDAFEDIQYVAVDG